jgi:hypothetical protein
MLRIRRVRLAGGLCLAACLWLSPTASSAPQDPPPGDGPWVVRATFTERAQVWRLAAEAEPWEVHYDQGFLIVDVDRSSWELLLQLGFEVEVDVLRTEELRRPRVRLPGQVNGIPGYPCYGTVEETFTRAQAIVTAHPTLATWVDVGNSWEKTMGGGLPGYDMMVLKLTNSAVPGPKPALFVMAAIHAREYTTAEVLTRFAEGLASGYGTDPDTTWILDHNELHLLLQSNPDGRKQAETGLSWRKNTDNNYCANTNTRGADLNRNYPFQWGCCGGSSGTPCSLTYRGPSAASEPEVQAVRDYVTALFPNVWSGGSVPADSSGVFIDLHSYGELVLWPWGYTSTLAPNATALQTLGRRFAWFNNHTPEQAIGLYPTDGTTDDFAYGARGAAAYTFEMGTNFFQDCASFESTIAPTNLTALKYAARVARAPYLLPSGPDALSVTAAPASVTAGQPVTITATVTDTRFNNSNGTEPTQIITAGEAYADTPPWGAGAVPAAMAPSDGTFNSTSEGVTATLSTTGWTTGRHIVFVRGRDASGSWGPVSAVFVDVAIPVELQQLTIE